MVALLFYACRIYYEGSDYCIMVICISDSMLFNLGFEKPSEIGIDFK